jgi:hypothetical protein
MKETAEPNTQHIQRLGGQCSLRVVIELIARSGPDYRALSLILMIKAELEGWLGPASS